MRTICKIIISTITIQCAAAPIALARFNITERMI